MKLYIHKVAVFSRPLTLFVAENNVDAQIIDVDVFAGECQQEAFAKLNRSKQIPVMEDDGFLLTECSAILKYLADKVNSPAYPKDLKKRARVNEAMDWVNTGFYREYGYHLIYPQILPNHKRQTDEANRLTVEWGQDKAKAWLEILDSHWLGASNRYLCGDDITIADYFASSLLTVGELIGVKFDKYPNLAGWIETMKSLPSWNTVHAPFNDFKQSLSGMSFVTLN
jgi:glutathione S-transferase